MRLLRGLLAVFAAAFIVSNQTLAAPLATGCLSVTYPGSSIGGPSLLDANATFDSAAFAPGNYDVYCVNQHVDISLSVNYSINAYGLSDPAIGVLGMANNPANLDLVEYVFNQNYPGQSAGVNGTFNSDDVQVAIWTLLDGSVTPASLTVTPAYSQARVDEIVAAAIANGEGYVAACGNLKAYIFNPVAAGCGLAPGLPNGAPFAQPLIFVLPVECPVTLECVSVTTGQVGNTYTSSLIASGGTSPYTYSITAGALPPGLALNTTSGVITGIPTAAGTFNFTAKVVDSVGTTGTHAASVSCAITIESAQLSLACVAANTGQVGAPYSSYLTAAGGVPPYAYSIASGSLATGLSLDPLTGEISGTPEVSGTFAFTAKVTDSIGNTGLHLATANCAIRISQSYCVTEAGILNSDLTTFTLSHALYLPGIGTDFIFGGAPGQFVDNGDGTATLTGTVYSRSNPNRKWQISVNLTGQVAPPTPAPAGSPKLELPGSSYVPTGPIDPATWSYQTGLTGTLTGLGDYAGAVINLSRFDAAWQEGVGANGKNRFYGASAWLNVVVAQQPTVGTLTPTSHGDFNLNISDFCPNPTMDKVTVACSSVTTGVVGTAFAGASISATGGVSPYTFSIVYGALPTGLSLNPNTGAITGTPTAAGSFNFRVRVVDAYGAVADHFAEKDCNITIYTCPAITLGCVTKVTGTVGTVYASNLQVTGGTPAYTFSIISGSLPSGLTLNTATGTISGTPTTAGTFTFTAKVVDSSGAVCGGSKSATVSCTITIVPNCPTITLSCISNGTGTVGTAYSGSFTVTGGVAPFTFSIISGSLPAGLTLNATTGKITGTPTTAGTFNFTAKVTGANSAACGASASATVSCSIKICPPANTLVTGDTATIGYWQGPNGQALIKSLNGGPSSTQLGNWLASNFPYLFGAYAGADNLSGKSNTQVAAKFVQLFNVTGAKTKAQIMASALAVYVTNSTLAGNTATASGFNVSTTGTGAKLYNVGAYGAPVGLVNYQSYSVMTLLKQANLRTKLGNFSSNAFNSIFDGINIKGDRL